jgi:sugar lactone lactonase YvrE
MPQQFERFIAPESANLAEGWTLERLTQPSRLFGANGIRSGADGRIYVAQVAGSQISAVDPDTGAVESISPMGGGIVGPDDLVFADNGNLYVTELTEDRVCERKPNGETRVVMGDMPCANPITMYQGRLFAGECRPGGRIMELDLHGGAPRIVLDNVPMPNAMEVGPDGMLYMPIMGTNEIWRVNPEGGEPEVVANDLGVPDAVKFDAQGFIISTQVASGQVLRINPSNGEKTVLATIAPGLDNLTFINDRLFVSSISGQINEILSGGEVRSLVPDGLQWPMGLAMGEDGTLFVADGGFTYTLPPGGKLQGAGMLFSPGFPGFSRGVAAAAAGEWVVTTANGDVARFWPAKAESEILASGYDRLMGVALTRSGVPIVAEFGTGRVLAIESSGATELARDLKEPTGVAVDAEDGVYVSEAAGGRVVKLVGGKAETVVDNLQHPQGIAISNGSLYIVDIGSKEVIECELASGRRRVLAAHLAIGAPPGVVPTPLGAVGNLSGPMNFFTGIAAGPDGNLYLSADTEGSVLVLRRA